MTRRKKRHSPEQIVRKLRDADARVKALLGPSLRTELAAFDK
jgi:hypothetical protein